MANSSSARRLRTVGTFLVLAAVLSWTTFTSAAAAAQGNDDSTVTLSVSPADAAQPFRTVAVAIDPGSSPIAAVGATLTYNPEDVVVTSCHVSEVGACNVEVGKVRASVFNLSGIKSNDQLLTVNFEPMVDGSSTKFALTIDTAVNFAGDAVPEINVAPLHVDLSELHYGSLTGDVIAADSQSGVYAMTVCATNIVSQAEHCTTTSGRGTWRIDDLIVGDYVVTITDPFANYAEATATATVVVDEVIAGIDASLMIAGSETRDSEPTNDDGPGSTSDEQLPPGREKTPEAEINYDASIVGRVTAIDNHQPLAAVQVCATQPLVLHQSCATTNTNGEFALADLSTGNYWITVVDPLARFHEATPKLVGVVGDAVRDGVQLRLVRFGA